MRTCTMCGSREVERRRIEVRYRGSKVSVQADVCKTCGEKYLDPKAIDALRPPTR